MIFNHKIEIRLLDFIHSGQFDCIKPGQTKEWILSNFPDPDGFTPDFLRTDYPIWTYGDFEFHFNKANELFLLFSERLDSPEAGESIMLDKWFLTDYPKLTLEFVQAQLNNQELDYHKTSDRFGVIIQVKSGVKFTFSKDPVTGYTSENSLLLSSLSLMAGN
jgi:hypothetical protein